MKNNAHLVERAGDRNCAGTALTVILSIGIFAASLATSAAALPVIDRFTTFGKADGIPTEKVHAVYKTSGGQLWIGTWDGLCVRQPDGRFKRFGPEHGLSHKMVLCITEDPKTGDLWIGTMRGLNKFSGGKIIKFTQTDSGLPNNVVYGVAVIGDYVWAATAAGAGALNLKTGLWKMYDHNNSAMHEPWCYSITAGKDLVYIGVWGSGIVEHDPVAETFKEYRDPDGDFHYDLFPDDGPISDVTAWVAWKDGLLWQCTYFGMARYDGKFWKSWVQDKTPLPSNFTQFAWPVGRTCWIGHDRGASLTDGTNWVNYGFNEHGNGVVEIHEAGNTVQRRATDTALANPFVLGIWADENEAWFATAKGLSHGHFVNGGRNPRAARIELSQRDIADPNSGYAYYGNTPAEMIPFRGVEPFYRYWTDRLPFRGPGKDYPDPPKLQSLKVGLLSPAHYGQEGARGDRTRKGVELAFAEANAARAQGDLPFEIVYREDAPQWGSAANIAVEFRDNDVLGMLGTIDGDATHVALRVALKTETYLINTSDPDPSLTETQIPWLTRVLPDERQQCIRLADLVVRQHGCRRIAVLREGSRPGRMGVMHFNNYIRRLGHPPVAHLLFQPGAVDFKDQISAIKGAEPDAVLFHGQPEDVGRAARLLRQAGVKAKFFGFDRLKDESFAKAAGAAAEGTTITYYFDPERTDKRWLDFVERFRKRWGEKPDIYAAYGYDGAKLMIEAIQKSGPNRYRIRDYLGALDAWDGVTGHMVFDGRWDNSAPFVTATYRDSHWVFEKPSRIEQASARMPTGRKISLGVLLPADSSEATAMRRGIGIAVGRDNRETNEVEVLFRSRSSQWGGEGEEAGGLVLDAGVQALIAPADRSISHLALQVAGRTRVPVVSLCPDASIAGTGIPWMARMAGNGEPLVTGADVKEREFFVAEYAKRFREKPGGTAALAYDAARLLMALLRDGSDEAAKQCFPIKIELAGASGRLAFDEKGERMKSPNSKSQIPNSKFQN